MPGMQAASASQRALFDCKRSKHSAVVQSQPEVWQPPKDYLSALPTDILLIIFKFVIADSEISCRREFEKWKIKAPNKYVTDQTRVTEFCSCMPEGPGRKGPRMPADYITLLVISKKLNSVVNDNAAFVELMCAKRLLIGKVEHARILVMVEEFRDLNERQEDALPATEHDFAKLRHRINNEPYTRQLVRKMIKAEHYVREILYFTTCYEYELIHSPEDYKPPYAKGGLTPTNIRFLTEAMLGRWNLMRKDKKIEACLEWVISKYFRGHGEKPFESRGHREDPPGFGGHDGAPIDWDELEQEYSYQSGKSTIKSITETLLFDFWQIDEEEMRVECTDFSYNECYARKYIHTPSLLDLNQHSSQVGTQFVKNVKTKQKPSSLAKERADSSNSSVMRTSSI